MEPTQLVEGSGGEVVVSCEAGVEDVRNTGDEVPKDPAEEEAARRKAFEEAVTRAVKEERARRKAHEGTMTRTAKEEAARRGVDAKTLIAMLPTVEKKKKKYR